MFDEHLNRQQLLSYFVRGPEWAIAVPRGDLEALEDVMRRCASFWNGPGTLLIPVSEDGRLPRLLDMQLRLRPVEACFLHERLSPAAQAAVRTRIPMAYPLRPSFDEREQHPLFLMQRDDFHEFRQMQVPVFRGVGLRRTVLALWGHINKEDMPAWEEQFTIAQVDGDAAHGALLRGQIPAEGSSPLRACSRFMDAVKNAPAPRWSEIWVLDRSSFDTLIAFWNYRARTPPAQLNAPLIGIPRESLRHPAQLHALRAWVPNLPGTNYTLDVGVHCPRYLLDEARSALTDVGFVEEANTAFRFEIGSRSTPNNPPTFFFPRPEYGWRRFTRGAATSALVAFSNGKAVTSLAPPDGFRARNLRYTRLVFDNLPLPLPVTRSAARRITRNKPAEAIDGVMINTVAQASWPFELVLPTAGEALEDWVQDHGFVLTRSREGHEAEALLRRLSSLDELDVLADRRRASLLHALTPRNRRKLVRAFISEARRAGVTLDADVITKKLAGVGLFLEMEARTAHGIASEMERGIDEEQALALLPPLVDAGFVRRVREVICSECQFRTYLTLAELDEVVRCRACTAPISMPVLDTSGKAEAKMLYRLDGLMARIMDQDTLPVLLALRAMMPPPEQRDMFFAWPGVEVKKAGRKKVDIDVLISYGSSAVWCFEVKKSAPTLEATQVDKLLRASRELEAKPAIAATEGEFPEELATKVLEAGGRVLTAKELFTTR